MNKDTKIYLAIGLIVILIIAGIYYYKNKSQETPEEATMKCIASKAILYSQTDCSHCKQQKQILGEYLALFNVIECDKEPLKCLEIRGTPTWRINEKNYEGVKSIKELSEIAGCECNANIDVVKKNSVECTLNNPEQSCTTELKNICTN
jgi:glutaredoxin